MVFILLFLTIATNHGLADTYDMYTPDYSNYHKNDDIYKFTDTDNDVEVDNVKYNDILSLLHNEYGNQQLFEQISNTFNDSERLRSKDDKTNETVPVKNVLGKEFQDDTRIANEEWYRWKRDDNDDKAVVDLKDIPGLTTNSLNDDVKNKSGHKVADVSELVTIDLSSSNEEANTNKPTVKGDFNNTRTKRSSPLKVLKDLFHHNTATTHRNKSILPIYLRQSLLEPNSTFAELIENLTSSIKILNQHIVNLKLNINQNVGFVMVKVPITDFDGNQFIKGMHDEKNETQSKMYYVRSRRDVTNELAVKFNDTNVNSTSEKNTTYFNVTKNEDSITESKENIWPTIISDSEATDNKNELNKLKRDVNTTNTTDNLPTNSSAENAMEKSHNIHSRRSNNYKANNESLENETNTTQSEIKSETTNDTENLKPKEETRKFFNNKNALLLFIEKAQNDIKELIAPVDEIRNKYSANIMYKIGYIIANLDTVDVTLKKLSNRLLRNAWDTRRLQKILKKLSMTKKLVKSVMEYLNKYAENQFLIEK